MIAVAQFGGHQALVEVGDILDIDLQKADEEATISFDVLLLSEADGTGFQVGAPVINGAKVEAKVVEHGRGDKVRVFKMKRRKRYRRTLGHKQAFTRVEIVGITGAKKSTPKKKTEETKSAESAE